MFGALAAAPAIGTAPPAPDPTWPSSILS